MLLIESPLSGTLKNGLLKTCSSLKGHVACPGASDFLFCSLRLCKSRTHNILLRSPSQFWSRPLSPQEVSSLSLFTTGPAPLEWSISTNYRLQKATEQGSTLTHYAYYPVMWIWGAFHLWGGVGIWKIKLSWIEITVHRTIEKKSVSVPPQYANVSALIQRASVRCLISFTKAFYIRLQCTQLIP